MRLLRGMRGSIEARDRISGQQQTGQKRHGNGLLGPCTAIDTREVGERVEPRQIDLDRRIHQQGHHQHDRHHEDQITRQVRDLAGDANAAMIQERLRGGDHRQKERLLPPAERIWTHAEHWRDQRAKERIISTVVDRGDHEHETEQIQPRSEPAPHFAAENRTPVIKAASRRIRRRDLRHRGRHDQREQRAERPAESDRRPARRRQTHLERRDAARQNADQRERHREVRERPHAPGQFLRVAHLVQQLDVVVGGLRRRHGRVDVHDAIL